MHMFASPTSPIFYSDLGKRFREGIGMPEMEPDLYNACKKAMDKSQIDKPKEEDLSGFLVKEL